MTEYDVKPEDLSEAAMRWIARLNSGTVTKAERQAWLEWRAISPDHEQAAREAESLWSDFSQLHVDPETGLVKPGSQPKGVSRRAVLTGIVAVGATGAVGASWSNGTFTRMFADHATSVASTSLIELPDGSKVTLSARSAIDVLFDTDTRGISLLQGEAFFEVAGAQSRPFQVAAGDVSVRANAAAFDITRDQPNGAIEIAVAENAVKVVTPRTSVDLRGGNIVAIDRAGRPGSVRSQNVADAGAWRQGIYRANARTLGEVVAALSPWYGGSIIIAGRSLHALRVDAILDLRDPSGSLDALQGGLPIRVRHLTNFLTVISSV